VTEAYGCEQLAQGYNLHYSNLQSLDCEYNALTINTIKQMLSAHALSKQDHL